MAGCGGDREGGIEKKNPEKNCESLGGESQSLLRPPKSRDHDQTIITPPGESPPHLRLPQRPYIIETMHSYTLPM